ncbi:MAG: MFS transporter [Acidobacteria bacterium RIFCSPLOWO2_02_FULL_68_18]|nr:MAG: MFS transporter [Acidobacteria bacterium RIFCSPLOWO2_02_FULL_68_18]OFW48796.1 MAG: MFS transporter [Acidobacteria bacterium RIFCSPLOWO2_12_FULL_68_19]
MAVATSMPGTRSKLTPNQIKGFLAAWGGWTLDGMDAFIYALVLVPALRELLPNSGIEATPGNIGFYGSVLFALFLFGWGVSMVWGPVADRFGRVTALMLTILTYSVFTLLCAFAQTVWQLAFLRVLCGIGIGGEQPMGGTFIAEQMPEDRRKFAAGLMHTGYYFGFFLAAAANYFIGANFGWRWMFALGGLPALMVFWIMKEVHEPEKWQQQAKVKRPGMMESFARLFTPEYKKRTIVMSILFLVSIIGLWAGSVYVPTAVTQIAQRPEYGYAPADAARIASYASAVLAVATIIGCLAAPGLAERLGRKTTMGLYFTVMLAGIALGFGYVFYMPAALPVFFVFVFILGIGGANFAMYTLWIPEQYTTDCRGSAIGFISSIGRFVGVAMVFLVGQGIATYGSLGVPVALTALAFIVGLLAIPAAEETKGKPLPA